MVLHSDLILNFDRLRSSATDFIRGNPITAGIIGIGVPVGVVAIAKIGRAIGARRKKRRKAPTKRRRSTRRKTTTTRRRSTTKRRKFGLRKAVRSKKILKTKNGQPYIILANGRARFIKKSSYRSAKKRRGGFHK